MVNNTYQCHLSFSRNLVNLQRRESSRHRWRRYSCFVTAFYFISVNKMDKSNDLHWIFFFGGFKEDGLNSDHSSVHLLPALSFWALCFNLHADATKMSCVITNSMICSGNFGFLSARGISIFCGQRNVNRFASPIWMNMKCSFTIPRGNNCPFSQRVVDN